MLFNANIDFDAEMNGFLKAYYGAGWQYIREFIDFISKEAGKPDLLGNEALWNDFKAFGVTRYNEWKRLVETPDFSKTPLSWEPAERG